MEGSQKAIKIKIICQETKKISYIYIRIAKLKPFFQKNSFIR